MHCVSVYADLWPTVSGYMKQELWEWIIIFHFLSYQPEVYWNCEGLCGKIKIFEKNTIGF